MSQNSFWKKAGWFIVALLPAALSLILQFGAAMVFMFIIAFVTAFTHHDAGLSQGQLMSLVQDAYMSNVSWIVLFYQIIGVFVFGLWYFFAYGKKKRPAEAEKPGIKELAMIVALGAFLQVFISGILGMISELFPELLEGYMEMMKTAGITEMTVITFIATVILAPIGEELLCRGVIYRLAGKVSAKFWVANCIQALAFGIIHANLVQGAYAFFLGLILGYIYGKYRNIWACMLLHGAVNLSSNFVDIMWETLLPERNIVPGVGLICALALVLILLDLKGLGPIKHLDPVRPLEKEQGDPAVPGGMNMV